MAENANLDEDINVNEEHEDAIEETQDETEESQIEETTEDEESEEETDDSEEEEPEEEPKVSRREQLRIVQLLEKMKEGQADPQKPTIPDGFLDYGQELEADEDTVTRLSDDRKKFGEEMYNQGLKQIQATEFRMQLNIDAPRIEAKYPQLDKNSDKFNPVVAKALNTMFLQQTGFNPETGFVDNPDIRYGDYIDSIFELGDEIATTKLQETTATVRRQASKTGIRPGGATKKLNLNKAPEDMSNEELKAYLDQYYK